MVWSCRREHWEGGKELARGSEPGESWPCLLTSGWAVELPGLPEPLSALVLVWLPRATQQSPSENSPWLPPRRGPGILV